MSYSVAMREIQRWPFGVSFETLRIENGLPGVRSWKTARPNMSVYKKGRLASHVVTQSVADIVRSFTKRLRYLLREYGQ